MKVLVVMQECRSLAAYIILLGALFSILIASASASIQEEVDAANPGDTIIIAAGTYKENVHINKSLTIIGAGEDKTVVDGNHASSVFTIGPNIDVTLSGMTIRNGNPSPSIYQAGGGIYNLGTLNVEDCTISGNTATYGGGIRNDGILTMNGGSITGNTARDAGGIYNPGTMIMNRGIIAKNTAATTGGGIYNADYTATVTMNGGSITENMATESGGGIRTDGIMTMNGGSITGNTAKSGGGIHNRGTLTMKGGNIAGNTANEEYGGGIYQNGGFADLNLAGTQVTIKSNKAHLPDPLPTNAPWYKQYGIYMGSGILNPTNGFDPVTQVTDNTLLPVNENDIIIDDALSESWIDLSSSNPDDKEALIWYYISPLVLCNTNLAN